MSGLAGAAVWVAAGTVAAGAAAATAHGLYEVAVASGVPIPIAWLYPLITDGLALVAYSAAANLTGPRRSHAWAVVVLAAGLSGLAQATYLAAPVQTAPVALRVGVGAWPAIAGATAAHLLHLLSRTGTRTAALPVHPTQTHPVRPAAPADPSAARQAARTDPAPASRAVSPTQQVPHSSAGEPGSGHTGARPNGVPPAGSAADPTRQPATETADLTRQLPAEAADLARPPLAEAVAYASTAPEPLARPRATRPTRTDAELLAVLAGRPGPISVRAAARELGCGVDRARRLLTQAGLRPDQSNVATHDLPNQEGPTTAGPDDH
jgi:hypothetical protein